MVIISRLPPARSDHHVLVVVRNLHFMCSICLPNEAYAVLIVDSDAVLPNSISLERFQPVSRRNAKINQVDSRFNLIQFAESDTLDRCPSLIRASLEKLLGIGVPETLNHTRSI
jgi:hypothetical protein